MKAKLLVITGVIFFSVSWLYAVPVDIIFTSDAVITEGDEYARVWVYDTPPERTTVSMFGGTAYTIFTYNASTLNMFGGMTHVFAYDESTINVGGGDIPTLCAHDSISVNVFGGSVYGLYAYDTGNVNVCENAYVDILRTRGYSVATVSGGTLDLISASQFGTVNLLGGLVSDYLAAGDSGIINIYGYYLDKSATGGHHGFGFVSGQWPDRTTFNIDLSGSATYSRIILHEIPEPATVLLIGIGSIALRRRRIF